MALTQVTGPYPIFTDLDGSPLDDGYLYIGDANDDPETNPIQVFWDSLLTIPATQPIRTNNGYAWRNGTPGLLYTAGEFSITIRNKRNEFVLYSPVGYGFDPKAASASVVKNDFTGDGVETDFTLSASPSTILATNIFINGVYQEKDSYTLTGNVITFSIAPPLGSSIEILTNETGIINAGNANDISYTLNAPGATLQSVQTKLQQYVSVKDFGAVGDGVTDDTAAIQAALDAGKSVFFPDGFYKCNNLTVSTSGQVLFATGNARLIKNGNGALLTIPVTYVEINGLVFDGTGYTGHNISASGSNLRLINSGSVHAAGRAVLATGSRVQIIGTNYVYQTDDATGTGYDIEIGTAGVATLYHNITGVYSSQATGGILMTSTGTSFVTNSQFGKLTLDAGGAPSGSGAPAVVGNRINGATVISQTGGRYSCNAFNTNVTVTPGFEFGYFGPDNAINTGAVITGTLPNVIMNPTQQLSMYRPGFVGSISFLRQPTDNVNQFGDNNNSYSIVSSGANGTYFNILGSSIAQIHSGGFRPQPDGTLNLGGSSQRWNTLYATNGTINTSDGRAKQQSRDLSEAERAVAVRCKALVRAFKLNDAVAAKGDAARWHFGVIAQDVEAAFASEGLNAADYGLFCYDKWEAQPEQRDDEGNILVPGIEAGERYGIRYDELVVFILGAI